MALHRRKNAYQFARRFGKDEDGAVMILTVILMLLLVKVAMSAFNVGVLTAERTRLQITADAAAYSSAVWQARFLNFCAYSRRAVIANYSLIAYQTAMEANKAFVETYQEREIRCWNCPQALLDEIESALEEVAKKLEELATRYEAIEALLGSGDLTPEHAATLRAELDSIRDQIDELQSQNSLDDGQEDVEANLQDLIGVQVSGESGPYHRAPMRTKPDPLPGMPRAAVEAHKLGYDVTWFLLSGAGDARETANYLNKMYSRAQEDLYYFVSTPWHTVIPDIIEKANEPVGTYLPAEILIDENFIRWADSQYNQNRLGFLNDSYVRQVPIQHFQEDIAARFDNFTNPVRNPRAVSASWLVFVSPFAITTNRRSTSLPTPWTVPFTTSRPYWSFDLTWLLTYEWPAIVCLNLKDNRRVTHIVVGTTEMAMDLEHGGMFTQDYNAAGKYFLGWQTIKVPFPPFSFSIPIFAPVSDPGPWEGITTGLFGGDDLPLFELSWVDSVERSNISIPIDALEPSVYAALRISRDEFVGSEGRGGRLFHNIGVPIGDQVKDLVAVSRAKVSFQPTWTGHELVIPNLYYPMWDAQLAPLYGSGRRSSGVNEIVRQNTDSLFQALVAGGSIDVAEPTYLNRIRY